MHSELLCIHFYNQVVIQNGQTIKKEHQMKQAKKEKWNMCNALRPLPLCAYMYKMCGVEQHSMVRDRHFFFISSSL